MTTWPGFSVRRAASARGLIGLLLALVVVFTGVVAGTLGHSRALATRAAAAALTDASVGDVSIEVQTRLGPDGAAQDALARRLLAEGFSPAPITVETGYRSDKGEPIDPSEASPSADSFVRWTVRPDVDRIQPEHLEPLAGGAERARRIVDEVNVTGRGITVSGDLALASGRAAQEFAVGEAFRLVPLSVLLLVAVVGLAQMASLLAAARERELHLLFARGASLRQVLAAGLAEAAAVAVAGAAVGTGLAAGIVWAASGTPSHTRLVLQGGALGAALVVACLGAVSARAAVAAARGEAVRSDRVRAVAGAAGFALVAALAALSAWQLRRARRFLTVGEDGAVTVDAVSALAPALLIALAAVSALLALAPLTRALERLTRRGRSAAPWLSGAHLARGLRLHAVPVVLTVLATATATFASLFAGTSAALQRDLATLSDGAALRAAVSTVDADYPTALSLPALGPADGVTAASPIWRADAAKIGDQLLPAVAAPTADLARVAVLPGGQSVPHLSWGVGVGHPRPLALPAGTTELEVALDGRLTLDAWQELALALQPDAAAAMAGGDAAYAAEILDFALAEYTSPVTVEAMVTLRDAATGQGAVMRGAVLELPESAVERDGGLRFVGAAGRASARVPLPVGRDLVLDAVTLRLAGAQHVSTTLEVSVDLLVDGATLLGGTTPGWVADYAVSEELAGAYREQAALVAPSAELYVEEWDEGIVYAAPTTNRPDEPVSFVDTSTTPWRFTTLIQEGDIHIGPTVAFDPSGWRITDPLDVMRDAEAATPWPVPVALTSRAAADLGLVRGDRIEVNAFGVRFPAEVAELVDWVPSVAGERALLVDSAALGASKAAPKPVLGRPAEVWLAADGDPAVVAEAVSAAPGVQAVRVAAGPTSAGSSAAAGSLWLAAISALVLAVTGLAAAADTQLAARRPEVAVLRAVGMTPSAQAGSRAGEVGGVLAIAAAAGLLSGWAVSALVVGPLAWSSAGAELATPLRPALPPLLALLLAGAVAVALIVAWLARTVRAQALDAEYREEVR